MILYHYDTWSRLASVALPNGLHTTYQYDVYGDLASVQHDQGIGQNQLITGFFYTYHQDGSLGERVRENGLGQKAIEQYGYDHNKNLSEYRCDGALCPKDNHGETIHDQHYIFDAVNNIKAVISGQTTTTYTYSSLFPTRLLRYQNSNPYDGNSAMLVYDHNGNVIQDEQGNIVLYTPLDETQLIRRRQDVTRYIYDGEGRQVGEQTSGTTYWVYGQTHLLTLRAKTEQSSYLYGLNRLGKQDGQGMLYFLTDQGRSVVATMRHTDQQRATVQRYAYSPYGIETVLTSSKGARRPVQYFGFDGQLTDQRTHWQFLGKGYRAYNPVLHRFMRQDMLSPFEKGGVNGYVFSRNNPIMLYDPTGHFGVLNFIPHTVAGWIGFGVTMIVGHALTLAWEPLFSMAISIEAKWAASMLTAGIANATGAYAEHGVATHSWLLDAQLGKQLISAFGSGMVTHLATSSVAAVFSMGTAGLGLGASNIAKSVALEDYVQRVNNCTDIAFLCLAEDLKKENPDVAAQLQKQFSHQIRWSKLSNGEVDGRLEGLSAIKHVSIWENTLSEELKSKGISRAVIMDANTHHAFYARSEENGVFSAFAQEKEQFVLGRKFRPLRDDPHNFLVYYLDMPTLN